MNTAYLKLLVLMLMTTAFNAGQAQQLKEFEAIPESDIEVLCELPKDMDENSGLVFTPYGTLIGHNDSGDDPILYEFNTDGDLLRRIFVDNAKHKDWEDITSDGEYIYIGDYGNNAGSRERLVIYKVQMPIEGMTNVALQASRIDISYSDQTTFKKNFSHNFDCEAMVASGDSLYLFTKNRGDWATNVYSAPKSPGTYELQKSQTFFTQGLITGADLSGGTLALSGYTRDNRKFHPFIWTFTEFSGTRFFEGSSTRWDIPDHLQVEAIVFDSKGRILYSNEEEESGVGRLYRLNAGFGGL